MWLSEDKKISQSLQQKHHQSEQDDDDSVFFYELASLAPLHVFRLVCLKESLSDFTLSVSFVDHRMSYIF